MTPLAQLVIVAAILAGIAVCANFVLPAGDYLPMQWGLSGKVNWSAPRKLALAVMPALYVVSSLPFTFMPSGSAPSFVVLGLICGAIQCLHIGLVWRSLR